MPMTSITGSSSVNTSVCRSRRNSRLRACSTARRRRIMAAAPCRSARGTGPRGCRAGYAGGRVAPGPRAACAARSEEHTSELQSQSNLVCRLLLEKKKDHDEHGDERRELDEPHADAIHAQV